MAGMFDRDKIDSLRVAELGDSIFIAEETKTPITRLLKRGAKPVQMLATWPVQAYPRRKFTGTMDGTDIAAFTHTNRDSIKATGMWVMSEGWMVTRLAELTKQAGVKNEQSKQASDDGLLLAQMIERQICSDMDAQEEAAPATPYQSRGIYKWLESSAQANLPVNASYRPNSACRLTTAMASLTPDVFEAALGAASDQIRCSVDLTGFVGRRLKRAMSLWMNKVDVTGSTQVSPVQYTGTIAEKKISQVVDFFEFDAGRVKTITSYSNLCDSATGEDTASTSRSGAFLDLSMWELCFFDQPAAYVMPRSSGGPRGYHDAVYMLKCLNPLGQISVVSST